jgi:hypothetical protein
MSDRSWTPFGYCTPEQHEAALEWERTSRDLCGCTHMRQEHFPDSCAHVDSSRSSAGVRRMACTCDGWKAPESAPESPLSAETASGRGLDAGGAA